MSLDVQALYSRIVSLNLTVKLMLAASVIIFVSILSCFLVSQSTAKSALTKNTVDQLNSLNGTFASRVNRYFEQAVQFAEMLSKDRLMEGMEIAFEGAFLGSGKVFGGDEDIRKTEQYQGFDKMYGERAKTIRENYGFSEIVLSNTQGQIVYTVDSESPLLGRNLVNGVLKSTKLATCYKNALDKGELQFADYEYVEPYGRTMGFFCKRQIAEFDYLSDGIKKGDKVGVVISEINQPYIARILTSGESGQAYVVGSDFKLRSDWRVQKEKFNTTEFFKKPDLVLNASFLKAALAQELNKPHFEVSDNDAGESEYVTVRPIQVMGSKWLVVTEVPEADVVSAVASIRWRILLTALITFSLSMLFVFSYSKRLGGVLNELTNRLAQGAQTIQATSDRVGDLSSSLNNASEHQAGIVRDTAATMSEITSILSETSRSAESTLRLSEGVNQKASSGRTVLSQMQDSIEALNKVTTQLQNIDAVIRDIGNKTRVINDIVFKTQILSFNASIEAARAGEHGKGFSVVAAEIANLADSSGKAANEIESLLKNSKTQVNDILHATATQVQELNNVSENVFKSFDEINHDVQDINRALHSLSLSAKEQQAGVEQTSRSVVELNGLAQRNAGLAQDSSKSSVQLKSESETLNLIMDELHDVVHGIKQAS